MCDALLILSKKDCKKALHQNVQFFSDLITAVPDLLWYISLHNVKSASSNGATLPTFVKPLIGFYNQERYKNDHGNISSENNCKLIGIVNNLLGKSFALRNSLDSLQQQFDYVIKSCIKYTDYLKSHLQAVAEYQALEEAEASVELMKLPFLKGNIKHL